VKEMGSTKSAKRIDIVKRIMEQLKTPEVFKVAPYKTQPEDKIKAQQYPHLLNEVTRLYEEYKGLKPETARERAKKNLLWEGNVNTIVHNALFFGTAHRPDLVLQFEEGLRIAIEIKRGETGDAVRDGIGQAIVYSACGYDFVVLLFIDTSKDGKVKNTITGEREARFIEQLWFENNVLFDIV
jgi:hypothetical protein